MIPVYLLASKLSSESAGGGTTGVATTGPDTLAVSERRRTE
jgi:hypothetical protein